MKTNNENCIFCKIVRGEIPSTKVYENEKVLAFQDIDPKAPVHILMIPKKHMADSVLDITHENSQIIAEIYEAAAKIARQMGLESFRLVNNCGTLAGQTVFHIHFHLLSGRELGSFV